MGLTQEIAATTEYETCHAWARAFYEQYSAIQGIRWRGRQIGSISVVLNDRASMNPTKVESFDLKNLEIWPRIARAARDCGFTIVG